MKKYINFHFILLVFFCLLNLTNSQAAFLRNVPVTLTQPDGTVLHCYATGDEYYNWLHDADGFTIIRNTQTGFYVYAVKVNDELQPSSFIPGRDEPVRAGLTKGLNISPSKMLEIRKACLKEIPGKPSGSYRRSLSLPNHGTMNNLVIFIRFSDETEFTNDISTYSNMFNNVPGAVSMKNYFEEVSYDELHISTTFYPSPLGSVVMSYQDYLPRSYFQPYDSIGNPGGYPSGERKFREDSLLMRAVISVINQIPTGLDLDYDNDDLVDNICFIIKGGTTAWSTLLWPHKSSLYSQEVYIRGKRVWSYNFQLNDYLLNNAGVGVLCHEMFHSLGAPDLYHYSYDGISPAGPWDIMENDGAVPQSMCAFMKHKYGYWIDSIPEIRHSGTYTLHPVVSSTNNAYKLRLNNTSNEYVVFEYRQKTGLFESSIPGSGLLIYRINTTCGNGNADGPPDEVYFFRPNGSPTVNGSISSANFSANVGRTTFNHASNPYPFLSDGSPFDIHVYNISSAGNTITFSIGGVEAPFASADSVTSLTSSSAHLFGTVDPKNFNTTVSFEYGLTTAYGSTVSAIPGTVSGTSATVIQADLSGLVSGTQYHFRVRAESSEGVTYSADYIFNTECDVQHLPIVQGFNSSFIPVCWYKQVVRDPLTPGGSNGPADITFIQQSDNPSVNSAFEGSHFVKFNSMDASDSAIMRLISSPFTTAGRHNISVSFDWYHSNDGLGSYPDEGVTLQWSSDGSHWNNIERVLRTDTITGWLPKVIALPVAASGLQTVYVAFSFRSQFGYNCYLDNVMITDSLPAANFTTNSPVIYQLDSVAFIDLSSQGTIGWQWTFTGAEQASSTLQHPSGIVYRSPGKYPVTLTATNAYGSNTLVKNDYITVKSIVDAGQDKTIVCYGSTQLNAQLINHSGSSLLQYRWYPPDGLSDTTVSNPVATPAQPTMTYIVTATDTNFTATDTVVVNTVPLSVATGNDVTINCLDSTRLNPATNHPTGNFFKVNTPAVKYYNIGLAGFGPDILSTFVRKDLLYIASNNGCSSFPVDTFMNKIAVIDRGSCNFSLKAYNAQMSGAKGVVIVNNVPGNDVMTMAAGLYADQVDIPVIMIGNNDGNEVKAWLAADTVNANIAYEGPELSFAWSPATGLSNPNICRPFAKPLTNTVYTVTVTDGVCSASGSVSVNIGSPSVFLGNDTSYCPSTHIVLNAYNPGASYLWNDLSTDSALIAAAAGIYSVVVTDSNGCYATDTILISASFIPDPADSINGKSSICQGSQLEVYATAPISNASSYSWTLAPVNAGTFVIQDTMITINWDEGFSGVALLTVYGISNCGNGSPYRKRVTIMPAPARPSITLEGPYLQSSASIGNQWYLEADAITGATAQQYLPDHSGNYYVIVTDPSNGCPSQPSDIFDYRLGISEVSGNGNVMLYPNPAGETVTLDIRIKLHGFASCYIYDMKGKKVLSDEKIRCRDVIDLSTLDKGIYLVKIIVDGELSILKLVKQ